MVTYRKNQARKHWHRPWPVRVLLVAGGIVLILAGYVGWALEQEYGGDDDRQEYVMFQEASGPVQVHGDSGVVFEGTQRQVDAWLEDQRGGRDFTTPFLLIVGGAMLVLVGVAPSPRKGHENLTSPPQVQARV
jgi:hypothetical protein